MMVVGIDIGYGYTKVCVTDGNTYQETVFPSLVSEYIPTEGFQSKPLDMVSINGKPFVVGEDVKDTLIGPYRVDKTFLDKPEYYAIIGYILQKIKQRVNVMVLGLPPSFYTKETVTAMKVKLQSQQMKRSDGTTILVPEVIEYVPQGAGIFFSHLSNSNNGIIKGETAIIDIGYYTVDATLYSNGKYISEAARSYPFGVNVLIDKVKNEYSRVYKSFIADSIAEQIIRTGEFTHMGTKHTLDISHLVKDFLNTYLMRAIGEFANSIKGLGMKIDHLLLGGGGVFCLGSVSGAEIVKDPQMANARGFCEFGKKTLTDKLAGSK